MAEFIENPRRSPRLAIRCGARIAPRTGASFVTHTVDVAPGGCQAQVAQRIPPGQKVVVQLSDPNIGALHLSGTVAWSTQAAPWRCGIAFDPGSARPAKALFEQLARAYPAAASREPFVERIPADAFLSPTPVPGRLVPVVPLEAEVLRELGSGVEARALRDRLGDRWTRCLSPLFALLGRGAIELVPPAPAASPARAAAAAGGTR